MNERELENSTGLSRRDFLRVSSAVAAGGAVLGMPAWGVERTAAGNRKRYVIVGTGIRHGFFRRAFQDTHREYCDLVGLCDTNPGRLELSQREFMEATGVKVPLYLAEDFDRMIEETRPDVVLVTTIDGFHDRYIIRAMEAGCDVITEKPMTTDARKCQRIIDAQRKTGRHCTVTFNYRYSPPRAQVKDILMSGELGDILSVDFHWLLDTFHGTDYFRRWHSQKKFSGGLMVHKATHHFDLVNWWLSAIPETVFALGKREFYTPETARRLSLEGHHERCLTCPEAQRCGFFYDLKNKAEEKALYLDHEQHDGYLRDRCVFRPEIDIEDTMNVIVQYEYGTTLSYSLNAFNAWEGYTIAFNGTKGRLEHHDIETVGMSPDGTFPTAMAAEKIMTRIIPLRKSPHNLEIWTGEGGHGGGDPLLLDDLFLPQRAPDRLMRAADYRAGAYSILIGVAANQSMRSGHPVRITDLIDDLAYPAYTPMPGREAPVPMPELPSAPTTS